MANQQTLFARAHRNRCVFSPCRQYRYVLQRWLKHEPEPPVGEFRSVCLWLMANPSVADEHDLDPTLTRCAAYSLAWGYDEMRVVNVRAFIATNPALLPADPEAVGPDNLKHVIEQAAACTMLVCGWGRLGGEHAWRVLDEVKRFAVPHALRLNQDGSPQHPLYLPSSLTPFAFERPVANV